MANFSVFRTRYEGRMYQVRRDGKVFSFAYGFNDVEFARSECRQWLLQRPDFCFVSVVVGDVLVAKAGVFPWSDFCVSLEPLGC